MPGWILCSVWAEKFRCVSPNMEVWNNTPDVPNTFSELNLASDSAKTRLIPLELHHKRWNPFMTQWI